MTTVVNPLPHNQHRWFQFNLRQMLWFVTASSCVLAWFAYEKREAAAARASLAPLLNAGAHVGHREEPTFNWRLVLFGDNPQRTVNYICLEGMNFSEDELKPLGEFKALRNLRLSHTKISDACLNHLEKLRQLEVLNVRGTQITLDGMQRLKHALPNCDLRTSLDED